MKRTSTTFLKALLMFIAIAAVFAMIRFPQTEGRARDLDLISIYKDPLIIYFYIASIPFFTGLYQAYKLLGFIADNKVFSKNAVNALLNIRNCALTGIGFIAGAAVFIALTVKDDDPAGFFALCIFVSVAAAAVAAVSSLFAKALQKKIRK